MKIIKLVNPFKLKEVECGVYERIEGFYEACENCKIFSFGDYSIYRHGGDNYLYCRGDVVFNELAGYNEQYLKEVALRKRTEKNWFLYDQAMEIINKYFKPNLP